MANARIALSDQTYGSAQRGVYRRLTLRKCSGCRAGQRPYSQNASHPTSIGHGIGSGCICYLSGFR
jgi:hypothetical protein